MVVALAAVVAFGIVGFFIAIIVAFFFLFVKAIVDAIRKPNSVPPLNDFVYLGQTDRKWMDRPEMDVKIMKIVDKLDRGEIVFIEPKK